MRVGCAMFRDDAQAFRAIRILLARVGIEGLWEETGPSTRALLLRDDRDLPLSMEKRTMLLAAWGLWSPVAAVVTLGDVLHHLDRGSRLSLCSLIVAYISGADAVDAWIEAAAAPASAPVHAGAAQGPDPLAAPAEPAAPDTPPAVAEGESPARPSSIIADWPTLDLLSVRYVGRVLDHVNDNKSRAAQVLGVDRRTVSRLGAEAAKRRALR
jgi:hypothetical protein